uniref:Mitochondrial basic amino acids transporter n=1 Tax=Diabrotica virgifera virgifera TaxID=50390 RepID=A0A6P7G0P8_DIAVI
MSLDFIAGCVGGVAGVFVGHPLDTVKVNLQTQCTVNPQYRGTVHCIKSLMAKEGIKGIYRGVTSPAMGVATLNAVVFGVYANVQKYSTNPESLSSHAVAGAAAGFFTSVISSPMELVKSRMQVAGAQAGKSPLDCLLRIYKQRKLLGVFQGYGITVIRDVPAFTTYFVSYEYLARTEEGQVPSSATILFAGGMAGVISWIIPYPLDVLKSKIQVDTSKQFSGVYDCFKQTVNTEGYRSLFRGMTPTLIRAFPVNAVTFFVVTWTMRIANMEIRLPDYNPLRSINFKPHLEIISEGYSYM